jgi:hypothetical protein
VKKRITASQTRLLVAPPIGVMRFREAVALGVCFIRGGERGEATKLGGGARTVTRKVCTFFLWSPCSWITCRVERATF